MPSASDSEIIHGMFDDDSWRRLRQEVKNLFPLFRYLILQTETHAFCLALAGAALLGFFPACLVILAVLRYVLQWTAAYEVFIETLRIYFPMSQAFVISNLRALVQGFGRAQFSSLLWVLLGAAGVFIPLETGFNRLWQVRGDRPYWLNQLVGFTLTIGCAALAVLFVAISTGMHFVIGYLPFEIVRKTSSFMVIRVTITCLFIVTVFALYKFLPNKKIEAGEVLPAAIIAGVMAELVRVIFVRVLPFLNLVPTQGPFAISVSFLLLAYFETFVVLGGAFLASHTERYPWMGFLKTKRSESSPS